MKYLKSINEFYDDPSQSLPKEEIRNIMNRKVWDKIHKGEHKKLVDIPYNMKDDLGNQNLDKISKLSTYTAELNIRVPYLKQFKIIEKEEKNNYFNLKYLLEKTVEDVAVFTLELQVMGTWNVNTNFIFTPFIERTETIKLNDPSYRVMNDEIVDTVETYIESIKQLFKLEDRKEIMKKMEDYFSDLKNGNIVSYEDSDFIKSLGFFYSTKKSYHPRPHEIDENEIVKHLNTNLKMYDNYTKTMFNLSVFEK